LCVYNLETVKELGKISNRLKKKVNLHLKVETGTSRQGIAYEDFLNLLGTIKEYKYLKIEGIYTHFANIEDTTDHSYTQKQLKRFEQFLAVLKDNKIKATVVHTACSAAVILFPKTHFDLVRVGISTYGLWSSKETLVSAQKYGRNKINLKPILTWKTIVAQIKELKERDSHWLWLQREIGS